MFSVVEMLLRSKLAVRIWKRL